MNWVLGWNFWSWRWITSASLSNHLRGRCEIPSAKRVTSTQRKIRGAKLTYGIVLDEFAENRELVRIG